MLIFQVSFITLSWGELHRQLVLLTNGLTHAILCRKCRKKQLGLSLGYPNRLFLQLELEHHYFTPFYSFLCDENRQLRTLSDSRYQSIQNA
jgi:hypothetical protein